MTLTFQARIDGNQIRCLISTDRHLTAPIFCFSLMAAPKVISGGTLVRRVAGYAEVALPDLAAGARHEVVLEHANKEFGPRNRAWLPLGAYLRVGKECLPLPPGTDLGPRRTEGPPALQLAPDRLPLVPQPTDWRASGGGVALAALAPTTGLEGVATLAERLGLDPILAPGGLPLVVTEDADLGPEGYRLTIAPDGLAAAVGGAAGLHYAGVSLLTLRETCGGQLPCGTITDRPRFGWRGQHLDCARHFFGVDFILRLLDLMALLKLNRFHWHFADDEAFRLEVRCQPLLWQRTAFRGEGELVPGVFGGGIRAGGSYSRADVARVLARAKALHIEVLPEIEIPAHSHAMIKAVPGLRDPGDNGEEVSIQGYLDNIVNPAVPATWDLLLPLAREVAGLFPFGMLHLGADEAPHGAWGGSPAVAALKAREGLQTSDDVQGWMLAKLAGDLGAAGVRVAAWEEAAKGCQGGVGNGALLFSWTGQGPGIQAARRGHDVVMCPAQNAYFDLAHSDDADDWGAAWAGFVPLEKTVAWDPVPKGAEDIAPRIAGVEACFWGEFTTEDRQAEGMIAPRILGIATKGWEPAGRTDGPALRALAGVYGPLLDRIGWRRHRGA
ncbi:beta-N-acetylhexosaminidase [Tabrizicola sp.]|uniref:beta-N-acetylhexosaminidase n=1 Tax=Tabrizicola sp. TaxID=2005166 RepID=UPI00273410B6|nr:family 20 glycosylhydrolase [Tabrizicola sp.]MDP3197875.1 family 20 glycosylhydrolase [Tabrizicola sp.]